MLLHYRAQYIPSKCCAWNVTKLITVWRWNENNGPKFNFGSHEMLAIYTLIWWIIIEYDENIHIKEQLLLAFRDDVAARCPPINTLPFGWDTIFYVLVFNYCTHYTNNANQTEYLYSNFYQIHQWKADI